MKDPIRLLEETESSIANASHVSTSGDVEKILPIASGFAVTKNFSGEFVVEGCLHRGDEVVSDWEVGASIDEGFAVIKPVAGIRFAGSGRWRKWEVAFELLEFSVE